MTNEETTFSSSALSQTSTILHKRVDTISVIIASYNYGNMIASTISNIKKQILPKGIERIEILIIDGMSNDNTKVVSILSGARVIDNPKKDVVSAKHLGLINCIGNYIVFLDQDEYFVHNDSINLIYNSLITSKCIVAITTGYYKTENYSAANYYASTFGDPVSFFYYGFPNDSRIRNKILKSRRKMEDEKKDFIIFSKSQKRILIEIAVMGNMLDFRKAVNEFPLIIDDKFELAHMFNNLDKKGRSFCFLKEVPIGHRSAESLLRIIKKIKWRINNNLNYNQSSGLISREGTSYILMIQFFLYVILLIPIITHTIYWALKLRRIQIMFNLILSFYVIIYFPCLAIKQKFNFIRKLESRFQRYGE
jgi:glycosyltransferase involved in cell wall biosynthesis